MGRAEAADQPRRARLGFADPNEEISLVSVVIPAKADRHMAIGRLADGTVAVVFAALGTEGVSVIPMRPASQKERSLL